MSRWPDAAPSSVWTDRFSRRRTLAVRGVVETVSVLERESGAARVICCGAPGADVASVREDLEEIARVLDLLEHPAIPSVLRRWLDEPAPALLLDCDAALELDRALAVITEHDRRVPYPIAMGLPVLLADIVSHAHSVLDPRTAMPVTLGSISASDLAVAGSGQVWLFGYGHSPLPRGERGVAAARGRFFAAPVLAGESASRSSDVVMLMSFVRSFAACVDLPAPIRRAYLGMSSPAVDASVRWLDRLRGRVMRDVGIDEGMEIYRRVWRTLGITPDLDGFRALLREAVEWHGRLTSIAPPAGRHALRVSRDASLVWFEDHLIDLSRKGAARRVLRALIHARVARPGAWVSVDETLHDAWPGERVLREAGANRVYVAVSVLRTLGLRETIERGREGYRIAPELEVTIDTDAATGRDSDPIGWLRAPGTHGAR